MEEITIKCKKIIGGVASGEAMVSNVPLSFVGEIDASNGKVMAPGHQLEGMSVAGKILIYPESKGSTCAGMVLKTLANVDCQPKVIVTVKQLNHTTIQGIIDLPPKNRSSGSVSFVGCRSTEKGADQPE